MLVCDVIIFSMITNVARSCGRCYHNSKRSLVIVSTLVLHLKAAESFLVTSQCTSEHNSVEMQKNPDKRWVLSRFYPVLAKIRIKKSG